MHALTHCVYDDFVAVYSLSDVQAERVCISDSGTYKYRLSIVILFLRKYMTLLSVLQSRVSLFGNIHVYRTTMAYTRLYYSSYSAIFSIKGCTLSNFCK